MVFKISLLYLTIDIQYSTVQYCRSSAVENDGARTIIISEQHTDVVMGRGASISLSQIY